MYSLKSYNTFNIDVQTPDFICINTIDELKNTLKRYKDTDFLVLGGGSNVLLTKNLNIPTIHINTKGINIIQKDKDYVYVEVQAGEVWHDFVLWALENDFGGIENLSLIPGRIGASPIQNIGAYGVEIKDVFHSCIAINKHTLELRTFNIDDCKFGYRESIFKNEEKNKYIILAVTYKLTHHNHQLKINYGDIKQELIKHNITTPSIKDISNAVIAIRSGKLPNPKHLGSGGSFFKNPIIPMALFEKIKALYPEIPSYQISELEVKVPAGWLIEKAGFKGYRIGDAGVHQQQALVLVNYGNARGEEIVNLSKKIQQKILDMFGITIEPEINIL
ncbi:MAG: UDP-N-acetylmuramate dehydrogenase [Bacteroidota bacterium]|nr:UDP-N-acetylmuramate dehydrogenase [Bacteroidota bacterium]